MCGPSLFIIFGSGLVVNEVTNGALEAAWDDIVAPALEEVFSWIGIEGENVTIVQKNTSLLFGEVEEDVIEKAKARAVISFIKNGGTFFEHYMRETRIVQAQLKLFYQYAAQGTYIHGLPDTTVRAGDVDFIAIAAGLNASIVGNGLTLGVSVATPTDEIHLHNELQRAPYLYKPWENTLTFEESSGFIREGYKLQTIDYVANNNTYDLGIEFEAEETLFWIEGPESVTEGEQVEYLLGCNRIIPNGESVTVNIAYTGTAAFGTYAQVATVEFTSWRKYRKLVLTTSKDVIANGSRTMILTIDSITDSNNIFDISQAYAPLASVTTTINYGDNKELMLSNRNVASWQGYVSVPITLAADTTAPFTVDYTTQNGTAIAGVDYTGTSGTLSFFGYKDERQHIIVPIISDTPENHEQFTFTLNNCSDPTVDISNSSQITITDVNDDGYPDAKIVTLSEVISYPATLPEYSLIVRYHNVVAPASEWFYWLYNFDGSLPDIDPEIKIFTMDEMLPVGIYRRDKAFIDVDKETDEYKTTRTLLNRISLRLDDLIANSKDNPDIDNVDDLYVNFSVSPETQEEIVSKVMWLTMYNIIVDNNINSDDSSYSMTFTEQDVNNSLVWTAHTYTENVVGSTIGEYEHYIQYIPEEQVFDDITEQYIVTVEKELVLHLKQRVSLTQYNHIEIRNLSGLTSIENGGFHDVAFTSLKDTNLTIPVAYYIIEQLDPLEQMKVFQHMLRVDSYGIQVVWLEWYETEDFLKLFKFVLIVITVYSAGTAGGFVAAIQQLALNYAIAQLVIFIAEETGNAELAAIVGIVAAIVLSDASGVSFDFTSAEGLISAATNFADNLTTGYSIESQQIGEDILELTSQAEKKLKAIEDARPPDPLVDPELLTSLNSPDTMRYPAIQAQYNFDLLYNYDRLVADHFNTKLRTGVT